MSKLNDFIDNFFDGLKKSSVNRVVQRVKQSRIHNPIADKLEKLHIEMEELDAIIKKYSTDESPAPSDEDDADK